MSVAIFAQWRLSGREAARGRFPIAATTVINVFKV